MTLNNFMLGIRYFWIKNDDKIERENMTHYRFRRFWVNCHLTLKKIVYQPFFICFNLLELKTQ